MKGRELSYQLKRSAKKQESKPRRNKIGNKARAEVSEVRSENRSNKD